MHQLQRSSVRSQHPSAPWNLRGGIWGPADEAVLIIVWKNIPKKYSGYRLSDLGTQLMELKNNRCLAPRETQTTEEICINVHIYHVPVYSSTVCNQFSLVCKGIYFYHLYLAIHRLLSISPEVNVYIAHTCSSFLQTKSQWHFPTHVNTENYHLVIGNTKWHNYVTV